MKIQSIISHIFTLRKNTFFALFFAIFLIGIFVFLPGTALADEKCGFMASKFGTASLGGEGECGGFFKYSAIDFFFIKPLIGILSVLSALASVAATIFIWILDPTAFSSLMGNAVFYEIWKIVRDTVNMLFILVLLFSAFATIYQIDKYRYNKILLNVIIMALLVNFSWPIARMIIDFFSSMMYFFVDSVFYTTGSEAAQGFLISTDFEKVFLPQGKDNLTENDLPNLLLAIITMAIFAFTLLTLSILLLIRLVVLPILAMLSPIGIAGMATPFTQSYASKWWDKLFKYASYGPMSVFMVLVALRVTQNQQMLNLKQSIGVISQNMSANSGSLTADKLAALVFYAIPITLFWMAMSSAEKMSSELSSGVTKFASSTGKKLSKYAVKGTTGAAAWTLKKAPGSTQIQGKFRGLRYGAEEMFSNKKRDAEVERIARSRKGYSELDDIKKRADSDDYKKYGDDELKKRAASGDKIAAYRLAKENKMDDATYKQTVAKFGGNRKVMDMINGEVGKKRVDLVIDYEIKSDVASEKAKLMRNNGSLSDATAETMARQKIADKRINAMDAKSWDDQNSKVFENTEFVNYAKQNMGNRRALAIGNNEEQDRYDKFIGSMKESAYRQGKDNGIFQ